MAPGEQETATSPSASSEQYKFEPSEIEKKPYHIGGFAEVRPVLDGLNKGGALYRTNFFNQHEPGSLGEFNSRVQMDGSLEKGIARLFARGNFAANDTVQGWSRIGTLYEGYLSLKPSDSWSFDAGKKTFLWGKGYAYNPAAFLARPKDPTDPELALEGFWAASGQYLRSFQGSLKTFSFQTVFVPVLYNVYDHTSLNDDFAGTQGTQANVSATNPLVTTNQYNVAARSYFLLYDTDIDLTFLAGQTKTPRYGMDFSRNIGTNLEVHGEASVIENFKRQWVDQNGLPHSSTYDAFSYLLGVRYLSTTLTTYILEYYRNGTGLTKDQMQDFFSYVNTGYDTYTRTGKRDPDREGLEPHLRKLRQELTDAGLPLPAHQPGRAFRGPLLDAGCHLDSQPDGREFPVHSGADLHEDNQLGVPLPDLHARRRKGRRVRQQTVRLPARAARAPVLLILFCERQIGAVHISIRRSR